MEVLWRPALAPGLNSLIPFLNAPYSKPRPGREVLKKGETFIEGGRPLLCDILWERDVTVKLRDGVSLYLDIFRPADVQAKIPAILAWSPYGKGIPQEPPPGVLREWVSGLQKFEGPDPAYWCAQGYAVVNVDTRGAFNSEGDIHFWGPVDARDGYEVIEWIASLPWCNGNVGMCGNSWLAISQWFIAAENPPHLRAIAPWEGLNDLYRHDVVRGGIPNTGFCELIIRSLKGNNNVEDIPRMVERYPLMNSYWESKRADLSKVKTPAYVVASWSNDLHTLGSLEGFRLIQSEKKWLRVHNTHEWQDFYSPENTEDLRRFFDFFLKGMDNGWENTPKIRLSILDPSGNDLVNREEEDWPVKVSYTKLYLDAKRSSLSLEPPSERASLSYLPLDERGKAVFTYVFPTDAEVIGYIKLKLFVEVRDADDADLFALLEKCDPYGNPLHPPAGPFVYYGPHGRLRLSHRTLDERLSSEWFPVHSHREEKKIKEGDIVSCEIPLWPTGMRWRKGEILKLTICGFNPIPFHLSQVPPLKTLNKGLHVIHTGGEFQSFIYLPIKYL